MRMKWPQRNFIDLFAGPGKNTTKIQGVKQIFLGSPLLALTAKHPFTGYYFCEIDPSLSETLDQRCRTSPLYDLVNIYSGDANKVVKTISGRIRQFSPKSLNLAFLDPKGIDLEWSTVAELGTLKCDLIIFYSQQGIERNITKFYMSSPNTKFDLFFGTPDWRRIYEPWHDKTEKMGLHRELIDFYKDRLGSLGYQQIKQSEEISTEPLMRSKKRNAPLYRLIFASKHIRGEDFWHKVTRRDVYGQKQLF